MLSVINIKSFILIVALTALVQSITSSVNPKPKAIFHNPIFDETWPDPHCYLHIDGFYYMPRRADDRRGISLFKSNTLHNWRDAEESKIYFAPEGLMSLWAPEIHFIQGNLYVYFAMDDGVNANHRMYVISAMNSNDPMGPYSAEKRMTPAGDDFWAIDATVMEYGNGNLYLLWSGWPTLDAEFPQNLYIASLSDPETISGPRVLINEPTLPWQQHGAPLLEGPQILHYPNGNRTLVVYSASGSWTPDYQLGYMGIDGLMDPLVASNWWKFDQPIFTRNDEENVFGVGHASFTRSKDGTEDWIVYHAMPSPEGGWDSRTSRIQRFTWNLVNQTPVFPRARGYDIPLETPSGE